MDFLIYTYGILVMLSMGQATRPALASTWMDEYRSALRSELVDGDFQSAVAGYRRVVASGAPPSYTHQAEYRCARALLQLGRDNEAIALLENLTRELPTDSPLAVHATRQLSELKAASGNRILYWNAELTSSVLAKDVGRLQRAAENLARSEGPEGVETIRSIYANLQKGHPGRPALIKSLALCEWPDVVPVLRSALTDPDPTVTAAAAEATGIVGDAESIRRLIDLLDADDVQVRRSAVEALHRLAAVQAVPALISLLAREQDIALRRAVSRALQFIGTSDGLEAASSMHYEANLEDGTSECLFSEEYRRAVRQESTVQRFTEDDRRPRDPADPPRIGVLISAMSHHAAGCRWRSQPYSAQARKAWMLQRAGFDVVLLTEALEQPDSEAGALAGWLRPSVELHPAGNWPRCDVIVVDNLFHISASLARTLANWCDAGGQLIVCGASGAAFCGDGVTWRQLTGVRRLHIHDFSVEAAQLVASRPAPCLVPLLTDSQALAGQRRGSFFSHDLLAGDVIASHDSPPAWAIKLNTYGHGRVLCFNWDVGLALRGTQDEDELICRFIDSMIDGTVAVAESSSSQPDNYTGAELAPGPPASSGGDPFYELMRHIRWGRWSDAKKTLTPESMAGMSSHRRTEAVIQLANLYLMENNLATGKSACESLLARQGDSATIMTCIRKLERTPRRLQLSLQVGKKLPWWLDVPSWQRLPLPESSGINDSTFVPLWLIGASDLQSQARIRVAVPPRSSGRLILHSLNADPVEESSGSQPTENGVSPRQIDFGASEVLEGWYEFRMSLRDLNAFVGIEMASRSN